MKNLLKSSLKITYLVSIIILISVIILTYEALISQNRPLKDYILVVIFMIVLSISFYGACKFLKYLLF